MIVGNWEWSIYEDALAAGLAAHGEEVEPFRITDHLDGSVRSRVQVKLQDGPAVRQMHRALVRAAARVRPDVVFLWRPTLLRRGVIDRIRQAAPGVVVCSYNNDAPFTDGRRLTLWGHYLRVARASDINFLYREADVDRAASLGWSRPVLLRSWFRKGLHRPLDRPGGDAVEAVVFIGHFEYDDRIAGLMALLDCGIPVKVAGTGWEKAPKQLRRRLDPSPPAYGEAYVEFLNRAAIGLAFLSGRNADVYTRRCFEIPACGTMLLAPRTPDLATLFRDGRDAELFGTPAELCEKARHYLENPVQRLRIAQAGRKRVVESGHDNVSRAAEVIGAVHAARNAR